MDVGTNEFVHVVAQGGDNRTILQGKKMKFEKKKVKELYKSVKKITEQVGTPNFPSICINFSSIELPAFQNIIDFVKKIFNMISEKAIAALNVIKNMFKALLESFETLKYILLEALDSITNVIPITLDEGKKK